MQNGQNNSPIDKGRVAVVVEKYQTNQGNQNQQPVMKNRYSTIGRATLWPSQQGSSAPNVEIELDTLPIGHAGKLKTYIFWDSDNQNNQQPGQGQNQSAQNNQAPNRWPNNGQR